MYYRRKCFMVIEIYTIFQNFIKDSKYHASFKDFREKVYKITVHDGPIGFAYMIH